MKTQYQCHFPIITVSADLYICETTDGVEYYYEFRVSLESAILMGALYQLYKVMEPLVRATIQWTEQGVNGISLVPFVLLQVVYSYYRVPMSQAFLFQKAGDQDNHTLIVCVELFLVKRTITTCWSMFGLQR